MTALKNFRLDAIHTFQIRTLASLGFHTRVTLLNKSDETLNYTCTYRVDLTIYKNRSIESTHEAIASISPGQLTSLDCSQWTAGDGDDRIMLFHLIPERLLSFSQDRKSVSIEPKEIWALIGAQDHYVEYFCDNGFSSGVLYQCGPMNYDAVSKDWSTLIQAPKICLSETINTYMSAIHTSFNNDYTKVAHLNCILLSPSGECVAKWTETIRPFESILVDFKKILLKFQSDSAIKDMKFFTLYAVCPNATVLPLILNMDEKNQTLAVEHSLPPVYYGKKIGGATRFATLTELTSLPLFKEQQ